MLGRLEVILVVCSSDLTNLSPRCSDIHVSVRCVEPHMLSLIGDVYYVDCTVPERIPKMWAKLCQAVMHEYANAHAFSTRGR